MYCLLLSKMINNNIYFKTLLLNIQEQSTQTKSLNQLVKQRDLYNFYNLLNRRREKFKYKDYFSFSIITSFATFFITLFIFSSSPSITLLTIFIYSSLWLDLLFKQSGCVSFHLCNIW